MLLCNLNMIGHQSKVCIHIEEEKIKDIVNDEKLISANSDAIRLNFDDAIAFPGLINSHDHLDFDLFPRLGNRIYESYIDWGSDIQKQDKKTIKKVLQIPKHLRVQWGIYKNLLNGITTVVHHGEYLKIENPIIDVFQNCYSLHSIGREKNWKLKLNVPFAKHQPFVLHVGEGTNKESCEEINQLIRWNLFKRQLIGVHGVSMNIQQAKAFTALIWCPDSNFFLLGATAAIDQLKKQTKILFGTDSTVSASWNLWEQLRFARKTKLLTDGELFDAVTATPASTWKLGAVGGLNKGNKADILIARLKDHHDLINSFFQVNPADILAVFKHGQIILLDESLHQQGKQYLKNDFTKVYIDGHWKYLKGNLAGLVKDIKTYQPDVSFPVEIY
jgi:cytosine/adenosine deaminase-related metal-dependent hydrolase